MYKEHFGFRELPFSVTPDPRFFYSNSHYQEILSTLRYGVEARKGLMVVTGEPGTGKTTLLRTLMNSFASTIHPAFIFDPHLNFTELLRIVVSDLGLATFTGNRWGMMKRLNEYLVQQLGRGHFVSVLIDEAQDLSDEVLEELRLLSNLETDREKLLQIVLIGQPELESKLDQPVLRQLKQRVALRYRLAPLKSHEVGLYINARLKAAGYEGKAIFAAAAINRIAAYSQGIPRVINVLCDNALIFACAHSKNTVSPEMIIAIASGLRLSASVEPESEPFQAKSEPFKTKIEPFQVKIDDLASDFEMPKNRKEVPHAGASKGDATLDELWEAGVANLREPTEFPRYVTPPRSRSLARIAVVALLSIVILGSGVRVVSYFRQSIIPQANLGAGTGELVASSPAPPNQAQSTAESVAKSTEPIAEPTAQPPSEKSPNDGTDVQTSGAQKQIVSQDLNENQDAKAVSPAPVPEADKATQSQTARPAEKITPTPRVVSKSRSTRPEKVRTASREQDRRTANDAPPTNDQLEFEIYKAIYNRAIRGVEVSVAEGTAYLDGWVATDRQKFAAAQAAHDVPWVKSIRNNIKVDPSRAP